jgi:hypothetical protein
MNFIKKAVEGKVDENVHKQFQKFSKGEFRDRAIIKVKKSGTKYTINTSAEFANELVRAVAEKLREQTTNVTGAVVSTNDLTGKLDFKEKKQFQGVKRYLIDKEISGNKILELLNEFPKSFFALSFESGDSKLKIKPKAPKSGKPRSKGGEPPKADFCKLITTDREIGKSFVFEKKDFKEANIIHHFIIDSLILPEGEKDFSKIRELAKKKGKIIREVEIDGQKTTKEYEFEA